MSADLQHEETIARYLLGDLPEEQQIEIEDRAFSDQEYRQHITAVENDLIDEYVRSQLSDTQRRQFENRFLASAARREKLAFSRALSNVVSTAQVRDEPMVVVSTPAHWRESLAAFFRGLAPAASFGLATAALLIFVGGAWLVSETIRQRGQLARLQSDQQTQQSNRRALETQIDSERRRNEDLIAQLEREKQQRQQSDDAIKQLQRKIEDSAQQPSRPSIISLMLLPVSRSGGVRPKLVLPKSATLARLQLGLDPEEPYRSFRVEVRTQDGRQVWTRDNLPARTTRSGKTIAVTLPASVFGASQYELALKGVTGKGTSEAVGYYYFEVLKK